ncbi:MAG TPA: hypothetical protein PK402_06275, partial [Tepidisphaeraceae bacterium]|nr:hypothetical protein [Tepidisphaeraceae bacterium]
ESGLWGTIQTVDNADPHLGQYLDLKLDNDGSPGVAYFDGTNGDLKYAHISEATNSWDIQTVESPQSTGLYPSLAFARNSNSAIISYYHKGKRDLKIATQNTETTWSFTTLAETGDQGRFSRIMLDPNRQDLNSRYVVAWEDSTNFQNKYAFNDGGWKIETITDTTATNTGGYLSLAFEDSGSGTTNQAGANNFRYLPRVTYYESKPDTSLKFSARAKLGGWTTQRVDGGGTSKRMGLYTHLIYNSNNKAEIYYFDIKNNMARRARATGTNSGWSLSNIGEGGRSMRVARFGTTVAWSNLNIEADKLSVEIIT